MRKDTNRVMPLSEILLLSSQLTPVAIQISKDELFMSKLEIIVSQSPAQLDAMRELLAEYGDLLPRLANASDVCA